MLEFTIEVAFAAAVIDAITGVALAWVLVRDEFPGKRIVNALIDLPFALPTIVAGLVLLTLYGPSSPIGVNVAGHPDRGAARVAVRHAAVRHPAVQPVLLSLETRCRGRRGLPRREALDDLPAHHLPAIMPATLTGAALAFARALGEFGSVVLIGGNLPHTQIASQLIFNDVENGRAGTGRGRRRRPARDGARRSSWCSADRHPAKWTARHG